MNISNIKNISVKNELKDYIWSAKYEIDVLKSKDRDMVERFNPLYANYDEWRECTDWQDDEWYEVYSSPLLLLTDSIIYFSDRERFGGFVGGHIDRIDDEKKEITRTCMESKSSYYFSMEQLKSLFASHFTKGSTYVFTYSLDGDYLTIFWNGKRFYDFVKLDKKTRREIGKLISPRYGEVFDEKNITWPRHADGSCDYDDIAPAAANETTDMEKSANTPATEERAESAEEAAFPEVAGSISPNEEADATSKESADIANVSATERAGAKQNSALPILPIAAGVASLAILLAVVLLAAKKKKGEKK